VQSWNATCGLTKGPCRHKETWWWNEEAAEAIRENKINYGNWKRQKYRRVDKMQRELFPQERKRNKRNVHVI